MRRLALVAILSTASTLMAQEAAPLSLVMPSQGTVPFRGLMSLDAAGMMGSGMLYPAPNVVGLLAAIVTHGVIAESVKDTQKQELQKTADKVLDPYRVVLDKLAYPELAKRALSRLQWQGNTSIVTAAPAKAPGWLVTAQVRFAMTQDQTALVLDADFKVKDPAMAEFPSVKVRVVSRPQKDKDLPAFWMTDDGAAIIAESANLFAHSLRIALDAKTYAAAPDLLKTVRYTQGSLEQIERATIVDRYCGRDLLRNLRGWFVSVPVGTAAAGGGCSHSLAD